jgi:hypothetical protein
VSIVIFIEEDLCEKGQQVLYTNKRAQPPDTEPKVQCTDCVVKICGKISGPLMLTFAIDNAQNEIKDLRHYGVLPKL